MGVVGAWIKVLTGFFILGATFILNQPIFDFLFALGTAMGGNAAHTAETLDGELRYLPVIMSLSLILWGFLEATRSENSSFWK
ncbi:hypothetical protein MSHOH_2637 [Methanosarcina horonobensis HB-1 = JCM 15518]|uniref:Uncharacterized protein n=1 Tax=Methanosarcina horonobensis HB-1 = JCM 15518 TaxID=1434110 RepID=A0A0E3WUC2_9EURY|nr:hypothetical protein [Methanosarcina horonobensis]AKB79120.1 hypothetical protein MSHOH_2637 [Methanosarcina horonobensis HB-1 = JCM 15518]